MGIRIAFATLRIKEWLRHAYLDREGMLALLRMVLERIRALILEGEASHFLDSCGA